VGRACIAVNAAMLTTPVWIDAECERKIGTVVLCKDGFGGIDIEGGGDGRIFIVVHNINIERFKPC